MSDDRVQRFLDLLADEATGGLDSVSESELQTLLVEHPTGQDDSMALAAASVELAFSESRGEFEEMPASLRARVWQDAQRALSWTSSELATSDRASTSAARLADAEGGAAGGSLWSRWLPWTVALASLVLVLWMWTRPETQGPTAEILPENPIEEVTTEELRAGLLGRDPALLQLDWTATEDEVAAGASGDVVWSETEQTGYMTFRGLATNDPKVQQYQLWIFDGTRDERYPVDGGVFDVPAGATEVVVPIRAKLDVATPVLFAVTVERPGGVVVSSRERIVLVAEPG